MLFNNRFGMRNCGCGCNRQQPIMEPVVTNCVEKEFYHEVPQD